MKHKIKVNVSRIVCLFLIVLSLFLLVSCGFGSTGMNVNEWYGHGDDEDDVSISTDSDDSPYVDDDTSVTAITTNSYGDGVYAEFYQKIDGDTAWFTVNGEQIKVRFLGIDTPETVKEGVEVQDWGPEASEYTTERLENANTIYLEFDPNSDREDAYGRTLAWVWVDDSLIELELLERGYAQVAYIYGDYLYTDELYAAQKRAQDACVGMWSVEY